MTVQEQAIRTTGAWAALAALIALLTGGTSLAMLGASAASSAAATSASPFFALLGAAVLAAISLFDMFTVPALHATLRSRGPALILVATGLALVGDMLCIVGRLTQYAAAGSAISGLSPDVSSALDLLEHTVNTDGFLIVSVSFASFGVLFWRYGVRWLGLIAIATGVLTGLGQVPALGVLFMGANAGFIAWYVGLFLHFRRTGGRTVPDDEVEGARVLSPSG